ncbi:hypothetical protein [Sandarakinorhabdus sp.]|uniref:hypothetical protein n=1 Tax=Sandarakinorhabdus sp. TaxID=1916663 RepID=UPI00286D96E3|nr:hypothetical protein [Sandarakinorhabdus sp.]
MAHNFQIERTGNNFFARGDDNARFFVGRRVPYGGNIGLYNIFGGSPLTPLFYAAADYAGAQGFWADFIEPTAICEGRSFLTLNSYDSAAFTFGFGQFAAHVPDGDFIKMFRALLARPEAEDYFPHLALSGGRIMREEAGGLVPLETATSTAAMMKYLNPGLDEVEDAEVIAAAKLIHWTTAHPEARAIQVATMVASYRSFMARADKRVGIDGRTADQCLVIADILHHGRGGKMTWPLVGEALASTQPLARLIAIGAPQWDGRKATLKKAIAARPGLAQRRWNRAAADFV